MSDQKLQNNSVISKPDFRAALDIAKREMMLSTNCHAVGQIVKVDAANKAVDVQIGYTKTYFPIDERGNPQPKQAPYPPLIDMPFIRITGGVASLRMPIAVGDPCIVLFNDRDLNNWLSQKGVGPVGPVASRRLHAIADGIVLVGFDFNGEFDPVRAILQYNETMVGVGEKVKIANNSTTLNTLLAQLITDIQSLVIQVAAITVTGVTTGPGVSGIPANAAAIIAINTQLTNDANAIAQLLE